MRWLNDSAKVYVFGGGPRFNAHGIQDISDENLKRLGQNPVWCELVQNGTMVCLDPKILLVDYADMQKTTAVVQDVEKSKASVNLDEFKGLKSHAAISLVRATADRVALEAWQQSELTRAKPRQTVLRALRKAIEAMP